MPTRNQKCRLVSTSRPPGEDVSSTRGERCQASKRYSDFVSVAMKAARFATASLSDDGSRRRMVANGDCSEVCRWPSGEVVSEQHQWFVFAISARFLATATG